MRALTTLALLSVLLVAPGIASAFCGGITGPVAFNFDAGSWGEKWPVLGTLVGGIGLFSTFVVRRVIAMNDMPEDV